MFGNFFYKNNDGIHSPAEIGLIKFTFRDGIMKRHHAFIQPEKVETGFAYTAKALSEDTHRLPPPPNAFGEKNYQRVMYNMQKFMREDGVPTFDSGNQIVFTYNDPHSSEGNQVEILKDFLGQFAGEQGHNIDIYPLTRLFYVLRKELAARGKCDDIPNEGFTNVLLARDPYESSAGISCEVSGIFESYEETRHFFLRN